MKKANKNKKLKIGGLMGQTLEGIENMNDAELQVVLERASGLKNGQEIPVSAWAWYKFAVEKEIRKRKRKTKKLKSKKLTKKRKRVKKNE